MSFFQIRRLDLFTVALGAAILVAGASSIAGASTPSTTKAVLSAAKASMLKEAGVHVVVTSTAGKTKSKVVVDIGVDSGVEKIVSGDKTVSIIITPTYAYLSGSATGLTTIMGLSTAQQKKIGTHTMSMKAGTAPYVNLKSNLTTPVFATMLPASGGTKFMMKGSGSKKTFVLSWASKASATSVATKSVMTFSSGKNTLPIKEVITSTTGSGLTTFTKWGEHHVVSVPSASSIVTYKQVFG